MGLLSRRSKPQTFPVSSGVRPGDDRDLSATAAGWGWNRGYTSASSGEKADGALSYRSLGDLDHYALRQRSRLAEWESPQGGAMLGRLAGTVVNSGTMLVSSPLWDLLGSSAPASDEERERIRRDIELRFHLWANSTDADIRGEKTFYLLQGEEYNTRNVDGETVIVLRYSQDASLLSPLQIQVLDADQLIYTRPATERANAVKDGVEIDKLGRPVAIHVTDGQTGKVQRIPYYGDSGRRFVLHPKRTTRPGQHRGAPILAPIIHDLQKLTDASVYELESIVLNASIAAVTTTAAGSPVRKDLLGVKAQAPGATVPPSTGPQRYDIREAGLHVFPGAGQELTSFDTKRPNVNFTAFLDAYTSIISARLRIPYEVLKGLFGSNYSASRAAIIMYWDTVEEERQASAALFWAPVYAAWFREDVRLGRIVAPGYGESPLLTAAWLKCDWAGIRMPSIDPLKEANAAHQRLVDGLSTHDWECKAYNGSDFSDNVRRLKSENDQLRDAGVPEAGADPATIVDPNAPEDQPPAKEGTL